MRSKEEILADYQRAVGPISDELIDEINSCADLDPESSRLALIEHYTSKTGPLSDALIAEIDAAFLSGSVRGNGAAEGDAEIEPEKEPGADWPILAEAAFHGIAGEIAKAIEPITEADTAAVLAQVLAAFGSLSGRGPHYLVEADRHGCNLFLLLIGDTAKARKGTSWGRVQSIFQLCENWGRVVDGLSTGEGLKWQVRDSSAKPKKKRKGKGFDEEEFDEGVADKRLLVVESEFGHVMSVMSRLGSTLSSTLRSAWDTGNLHTLTRHDPITATGAHISIVGHVTGSELMSGLQSKDADNGFINRFLMLCVRRSKCLPGGGEDLADSVKQGFARRLARCAGNAMQQMRRSGGAEALWRRVYPALSEGAPGLLGAVTARAEAHVVRLALIYALLDERTCVDAEHLDAALALWDYCAKSAAYAFRDGMGPKLGWKDGDEVARKILEWLKKTPGGMSKNEIRDIFSRHLSAEKIGQSLNALQQARMIMSHPVTTTGRPKTIFKLAR